MIDSLFQWNSMSSFIIWFKDRSSTEHETLNRSQWRRVAEIHLSSMQQACWAYWVEYENLLQIWVLYCIIFLCSSVHKNLLIGNKKRKHEKHIRNIGDRQEWYHSQFSNILKILMCTLCTFMSSMEIKNGFFFVAYLSSAIEPICI